MHLPLYKKLTFRKTFLFILNKRAAPNKVNVMKHFVIYFLPFLMKAFQQSQHPHTPKTSLRLHKPPIKNIKEKKIQ